MGKIRQGVVIRVVMFFKDGRGSIVNAALPFPTGHGDAYVSWGVTIIVAAAHFARSVLQTHADFDHFTRILRTFSLVWPR